MSRNQNGGFNKFLNFIGIVDDDRYDDGAESYTSGSYGRPAAYTPAGRQRNAGRAAAPQRSIPAQAGRSSYGSAGARRPYSGEDSRYSAARRSVRFEDDNRDFAPQQRPQRARSRFEEIDESAAEGFNAPVPAPARRPAPNTGATVMFPIRTLTDVNPVIKSLIRGDSIVMTLEAEDDVMERRILDTLSGAVFALDATFRKPSKNSNTYLLAPKSVSIKTAYELED